ncbi:hypothetical protein OJJOAM_001465 [Cupriavidus sp. H18C1]|uniref:hypothetical protein n=1 Tax=Cupriavidus sp. H18C1 TaxID=3241601 RepID=UPI003BB96CBC
MKINKNAAVVLSLAALSVAPAWGADKARTNAGDDWAKHVQQAAEPASSTMANTTSGTRLGPHAALFWQRCPGWHGVPHYHASAGYEKRQRSLR